MADEESCSSFQESEDDSDKELQDAFAKGLLKPGLNTVKEVTKRQPINNVNGLKTKLNEFRKRFDWFERLDVITDREQEKSETPTTDKREDDFKRECSFYKQAQLAAMEAIPKLHQLGVTTQRPVDYYAEMAKTDNHMKKVREKLVSVQTAKERSELARKLRAERKFAVQIQKDVLKERQTEKKMLLEAVKKHKKGFKDQLNDILEKKPSKGNPKRSDQKRSFKNAKYGYGGRKKRSKLNTAESSAASFGYGGSKGGPAKGATKAVGRKGAGKSKQKRPGKSKRVKAKRGKGRS